MHISDGSIPVRKPKQSSLINDTNVKARSLCNVHGLWTNKA